MGRSSMWPKKGVQGPTMRPPPSASVTTSLHRTRAAVMGCTEMALWTLISAQFQPVSWPVVENSFDQSAGPSAVPIATVVVPGTSVSFSWRMMFIPTMTMAVSLGTTTKTPDMALEWKWNLTRKAPEMGRGEPLAAVRASPSRLTSRWTAPRCLNQAKASGDRTLVTAPVS
jgi:hypothetical protein